MKVKVTKEFPGLEDGATQVRQILKGDVIGGNLAEVALANGWGKELGADGRVKQQSATVDETDKEQVESDATEAAAEQASGTGSEA